jgi:hypothetical protein
MILKKKKIQRILSDIDDNKYFKHFSIKYDYNKNNVNKFMKIVLNEKKIRKKMKKIERLTKLYSAVDCVEKKEFIDENKFFKIDKKDSSFLPYYREKKKNTILLNYNKNNYLYKLGKKKNTSVDKEKSIYNQSNSLFSFNKNKNNENSISNIFDINKNFKKAPKIFLTPITDKSSTTFLNDLNIDSLSNISRIPNNIKNNRDKLFLTSFPNNIYSKIKNRNIKSSLFNMNKNIYKSYHSLKAYKSNQNSKEIEPIIYKIIYEGKKIDEIIKKNYLKHKQPKMKNSMVNILEEHKLDLEKLRENLKLKDSKGIYGNINEIQIMDNIIKKMTNVITKKQINILKSVAKAMIREDLLLNKRLIYNVGLENRFNLKKFLEVYKALTIANRRKKAIEANYIIHGNKVFG